MYNRDGVPVGSSIELRMVFTDNMGVLVDALPEVYIYSSEIDLEVMAEEIEAQTYDSADGPFTPIKISTGYYRYSYVVPVGSEPGVWRDVWIGTVAGVETYSTFTFLVSESVIFDIQTINKNTLMVIKLSDEISNKDNTEVLKSTVLRYLTILDPFYVSPDLVRLETGNWLTYIPDDTLALIIHWSSQEAKFICGPEQASWGNIKLARTKFVMYDAALRCINQPGTGLSGGSTSGKSKTLGDLSVKDGTAVEVDSGTVSWLQKQRDEWWRVVNAGGNIVPGQGFEPVYALKGEYDPDRKIIGRGWESPSEFYYVQPTVNERRVVSPRLRARYGFYERY